MSGTNPVGFGDPPSQAAMLAVKRAIEIFNSLQALDEIREPRVALFREIDMMYHIIKHLWDIFADEARERTWLAPIRVKLAAMIEDLDSLLEICTNDSSPDLNRPVWIEANERIERILLKARVTVAALNRPSLASMPSTASLQLQLEHFSALMRELSSLKPIGKINIDFCPSEERPWSKAPLLSVRKMHPMMPIFCSWECDCRCHRGLQQHPTTAWLRSVLGRWANSILTISVLYTPACSQKECVRRSNTEVEIVYWFPRWLLSSRVFFQGLYASSRGLSLWIRSSQMFELSSASSWIGDPDLVREHLRQGFHCFPEEHINTESLLLEWMIYRKYFGSIQVLVDMWNVAGLLSPGRLPRQVGYAINWTLTEDPNLQKSQVLLLQYLKTFLNLLEFSDRRLEAHDAVVHCEEDDDDGLRQALLAQPWLVDVFDKTGRAPIHLATQYNRIRALKCLIEEGADVNLRDAQNRTPLQLASHYRSLKCLMMLLETKRCRVDEQNGCSKTALHLAAEAGAVKAVASLINAGASATKTSREGGTVLHFLSLAQVDFSEAETIVHLLQSKQADVNARDDDGNTPALAALKLNNLPVLKALFEAGSSLHLVNHSSQNMLHFAALHADVDLLEYLAGLKLEGIHTALSDKFGHTPENEFHWVTGAEDSELVLPLRRPSPAAHTAFIQLLFGVLSRNLRSDLHILRQLLQMAEQEDVAATGVQLSILISLKETHFQHDHARWYRGIVGLVEEGRWELAIDHIQSDLSDTVGRISSTQNILDGLVDPFTGDPNLSSEGESGSEISSSDTDGHDANQEHELSDHSGTQGAGSVLKDETDGANNISHLPTALPRQILDAIHWLPSTAEDPTMFKDRVLESEEILIEESGDYGESPQSYHDTEKTGSCLQIPYFSLPELVDAILHNFIPVFEPPVPTGKTRVRWKCICGDNMFDDFTEVKPGSLDQLRARLSGINRTVDGRQRKNTPTYQMPLVLLRVIGTWIMYGMMRLIGKGNRAANIIPVHAPNPQEPQQSHPPQNNQVLHLLLCIDKGESLTRLHQDRLQGITGDKELFSFLRDRYFEHRKFTSWFALRSVKNVSLARFRVDANYVAGVHSHDVACSSECICLPPLVRIKSEEYRCAPAPKVELGYFPALGSRELLHYFKKPHDFEIMQRIYLNQIPKRACGQLRASQDEAELGWGLHLEEGWHWTTIYFITVVLVAIAGIAFGVIWSVTKGDIQSAFAISGAWMTLGPLMLGYMALKEV